jgi:diguanylate cyclase (GGDEF)-like protein/PAS domain S-box-containing protein
MARMQTGLVPRWLSLQVAVLVAVFTIGLAMMGLDGWRTWQARAAAIAADRIETANLAKSLAEHTHDILQMADTVLLDLRERVEADDASPDRAAQLHQVIVRRIKSLPMIHGLFVYDANGTWRAEPNADVPRAENNSDRAYFRYHSTHADRGTHIGYPVRSKSDGSWIITVSRRVDTVDGAFAGVVLATISIDSLSRYYGTFDIGQQGAIALETTDGILVARVPLSPNLIGTDTASGDVFHNFRRQSDAGSLSYRSALDGITRFGSYHRVDDYPLFLVMSHSLDELLADWRLDAARHFAISGAAAVTVALLGIFFARLVRARQHMERRYRLLADNSTDAIMCIGQEGRKLYVSPAFSTLTGWSHHEAMTHKWGALVHPDDRDRVVDIQRQLQGGAKLVTCCYRYVCKDGSYLWVESRVKLLDGANVQDPPFVANIRDITLRKAAEEQVAALNRELAAQANTDALTGLANRRRFDERLGQEWLRAVREGTPLSLLMIDVDRFKAFNDRYGHQQGDQCLRALAVAMVRCARRPADVVARYGGEEMVILLPDTDVAGAFDLAERVRAAIEATGVEHAGNPPALVATASIGVATMLPVLQANANGAPALVEAADGALYEAKRTGRNRVVVAQAAPAMSLAGEGQSPSGDRGG